MARCEVVGVSLGVKVQKGAEMYFAKRGGRSGQVGYGGRAVLRNKFFTKATGGRGQMLISTALLVKIKEGGVIQGDVERLSSHA